jgi:VCBS repeat-containing protein
MKLITFFVTVSVIIEMFIPIQSPNSSLAASGVLTAANTGMTFRYAQLDSDPDAIALLPLDEGSGTTAGDVSGLGNHGTLVNGATWSSETGDGSAFSVNFDGSDDRIDLGPLDVIGSGLTLAAWFKADSFPGPSSDPRLISKATGVDTNQHIFMLSTIQVGSSVRLRARVRIGGNATTLIASSGNLAVNQWRHAAVTYDGTMLRLYLDGQVVGSTPLTGAVDVAPTVSVAVGNQPGGAGLRGFDGLLDDIRILQRPLSESELAAIVTGENLAPVAQDDNYATLQDTTLVVDALNGVLANDTDPNQDSLSATLVTTTTNGSLTLNPDGSFTYIPESGFNGQDTFTYQANDGLLDSNIATVTILVEPVNNAPIAQDDNYATPEDTTLVVDAPNGVLANDTSPNSDPLSAILATTTSNGSLTLNSDGSFTYIPSTGFIGQDTFTYRATNGSFDSNLATVTISIGENFDPEALVHLPLDEGSGTVAGDVSGLGNHGTLVNGAAWSTDTADGSPHSVSFDGVNDYIDLGVLDVAGSGLTLAAWFKADSFPGPSRDPRIISKATGLADGEHVFMLGTIQVGSSVRLRARVRVSGVTTTLIASSGNLAVDQWRHAAVTYDGVRLRLYLDGQVVGSTPLTGAVDVAPTVPVTVGSQPPGAGGRYFDGLLDDIRILQRPLSESELAAIVAGNPPPPENNAPVAVNDAYTTMEDTELVVDAASGVLANDTDADGDVLTVVLVTPPAHGSLTLNPDGSFQYIPQADFYGQDAFTYRASDGYVQSNVATVTLTIEAVNDEPVARDDSYWTAPDTELVVNAASGVLANDIDVDGDVLTAVLVAPTTNGSLTLNPDGSFSYMPNGGFSGQDIFTYRASDGVFESNLATVTITVEMSNSPPRIITGMISFTKQIIATGVDETHYAGAADFTGNGFLDVVATDYIDGAVLWFENDGNGGFTTRTLDANLRGAYPGDVVDLDLDGDMDILAAGYLADTYVWYENIGGGNFIRHNVDTNADGAHSIVSGDMDGDGDLDLLTANQDSGEIAWYENDGNFNFTKRLIDSTAFGAKRAEFADVNGDGDMDVFSASFFANEIAWYENDGNQNFTKHIINSAANGAYYVYPADINGDGDIDVLSASQFNNTIAWFENLGNGSFRGHVIDNTAFGARTVIGADIDGDGHIDAVTASVDDDTVAWYKNDGNGNFTWHPIDLAADGAYNVFAIDMDFDGDIDVISASRDAGAVAIHTHIRVHQISVAIGGSLLIDQATLETVDDTDGPSDLIYTLIQAPSNGELQLNGIPVSAEGTFTQADINSSSLAYVHGGAGSSLDYFSFSVQNSGGGGIQPATGSFSIIVTGIQASIVELPLNEGSGTVAEDVSGLGNHGTLVNGAAWSTDTADGSSHSVSFDGVNDYIDLGVLDVIGSGLTLAAWFKADSFPGPSRDPRIISKATGLADGEHVFMLGTIQVGSSVRLRARLRVGGVTTTLIASSGNLAANEWQHAAVTYDGITLRLYLDGQVVGSTPLTGAVDVAPTVPVTVGSQPPGAGGRYFDGLLDDIRILQRPLSESELAAIVAGNPPPPENNAPVAVNDAYTTMEDTELVVDAASECWRMTPMRMGMC